MLPARTARTPRPQQNWFRATRDGMVTWENGLELTLPYGRFRILEGKIFMRERCRGKVRNPKPDLYGNKTGRDPDGPQENALGDEKADQKMPSKDLTKP